MPIGLENNTTLMDEVCGTAASVNSSAKDTFNSLVNLYLSSIVKIKY